MTSEYPKKIHLMWTPRRKGSPCSVKGPYFINSKSLVVICWHGAPHAAVYWGELHTELLTSHAMPCLFNLSVIHCREVLVSSVDQWTETCLVQSELLHNNQSEWVILTNQDCAIWTNQTIEIWLPYLHIVAWLETIFKRRHPLCLWCSDFWFPLKALFPVSKLPYFAIYNALTAQIFEGKIRMHIIHG